MLNDINVAPECQLTPVKHKRRTRRTTCHAVACATFVDFTLCPTFLITHNFLQYYTYTDIDSAAAKVHHLLQFTFNWHNDSAHCCGY